jgi:hypothetical protein
METNLTKFNNQLDQFLTEIYQLLPDQVQLRVVQDKLRLVRSMNSRIVMEYFAQHVLPYQDRIMNQEESFFIDNGEQLVQIKYDENIQTIQSMQADVSKDEVVKVFRMIKGIWSNRLSAENKQVIWDYFKVLVVLCKRYYKLV